MPLLPANQHLVGGGLKTGSNGPFVTKCGQCRNQRDKPLIINVSNESAPGQPPEVKITPTEQVKQNIKDHVKSAEVGTVRGMAIRDFIDHDKAYFNWKQDQHDTLATIRYAITDETIRQRKNGVKGYVEEFESFENLSFALRQAFSTDGLPLERKGGGGFTVREDHQFFDLLLKSQ